MTESNRSSGERSREYSEVQRFLECVGSEDNLFRPSSEHIYIISQNGQPRWIVPHQSRDVVPVLKSWRPYRFKSRLQWQIVTAFCRANAVALLPGAKREAISLSTDYWSSTLPGFKDSWHYVVYVGTPCSTRKAIIFFVSEEERVEAVAKVPISSAAKEAILNEARMLQSLNSRLPVADVLFFDEQRGIAAQGWIEGDGMSRQFQPEHLNLLTTLRNENETIRLVDRRHDIQRQLDSLDVPLESSILKWALSALEVAEALTSFTEHRDFAPWNFRRLRDGRITLIDWEWAVEVGLPWQDICQYFYIQDYLFQDSANVWTILTSHPLLKSYCDRFGLRSAAVRGLTTYYLLRVLCDNHISGNTARVEHTIRKLSEVCDSAR